MPGRRAGPTVVWWWVVNRWGQGSVHRARRPTPGWSKPVGPVPRARPRPRQPSTRPPNHSDRICGGHWPCRHAAHTQELVPDPAPDHPSMPALACINQHAPRNADATKGETRRRVILILPCLCGLWGEWIRRRVVRMDWSRGFWNAWACWTARQQRQQQGDGNNEKGYRAPVPGRPAATQHTGAPLKGFDSHAKSRPGPVMARVSGGDKNMQGPARPRLKLPWRATGFGQAAAFRHLPPMLAARSGLGLHPKAPWPAIQSGPHARSFGTTVSKQKGSIDPSRPWHRRQTRAGLRNPGARSGPGRASFVALRVCVVEAGLCCSQPNCRRVASTERAPPSSDPHTYRSSSPVVAVFCSDSI